MKHNTDINKTGLSYGLLGEHLSHSRSPRIHSMLADYPYCLFPTPPENLASFLESRNFLGLNVTIPYKERVIPYLQHISDEAAGIGSVNTITVAKDGSLIGDNTDYYGFLYLLNHNFIFEKAALPTQKALVLGSGGASKSVRLALSNFGFGKVVIISRSGEDNYDNLDRHSDAVFIVNTTPVGMYPDNGKRLLSLDCFQNLLGVADIIYNPLQTTLLLDAKERGIPYANGLSMLVAQAALTASLFTGQPLDENRIASVIKTLSMEETNLILIGMPGCGKSTLGKLLAKKLNRDFIDTDELVYTMTGHTPAELIRENGEAAFRAEETKALEAAGKQNGKVIATGGGIVTVEANYRPLAQNGIFFFIHRAPELLSTAGRPLSASRDAVLQLFEKRLPLYRKFADYEIEATDTVESTFDRLMESVLNVFPSDSVDLF